MIWLKSPESKFSFRYILKYVLSALQPGQGSDCATPQPWLARGPRVQQGRRPAVWAGARGWCVTETRTVAAPVRGPPCADLVPWLGEVALVTRCEGQCLWPCLCPMTTMWPGAAGTLLHPASLLRGMWRSLTPSFLKHCPSRPQDTLGPSCLSCQIGFSSSAPMQLPPSLYRLHMLESLNFLLHIQCCGF